MRLLSRIAALVVAVGLVVGAVLVRQAREGGGDTGIPSIGDDPLAAACPAELEELCLVAVGTEGVEWSFASAAIHARALEGDEPVAAVLPTAWADVADDARSRAGEAPLVRSEVIATTPLLLVGFEDRVEVLAAACGRPVPALGWDCIGDHAGARWEDLGGDVRWGSVVPGHLSPATATGLVATAEVVAARTGTPFSLAELRDVGFTTWFGRVERSVADFTPPGGSHLTAMVTRGPSVANIATATEAETITRGLDTAFGRIVVSAPDPLHVVALAVVGNDEAAVAALADRVDPGALADAGWRTGDGIPSGAPLAELPEVTPTPNGGVLTAVRDAWDAVAG